MADSTVLDVLILVTLGTATGGKWERVTLFIVHSLCLLAVAQNVTVNAKYCTACTYILNIESVHAVSWTEQTPDTTLSIMCHLRICIGM